MDGSQGTTAARPALRTRAEADRLVVAVLRDHGASLLRVARRHSLCDDDAQDAYQRAVEIFLRHAPSLDAAEAHKWVHTVVKHEAMRLRGQRMRTVGDEVDLDGHEAGQLPTADEQLASFDLMTRSAEALQRLKPHELRALWLKAQGHSYQEIADINGWTFTKVNRPDWTPRSRAPRRWCRARPEPCRQRLRLR
ncbi:MAG: RNA polymerase sigma factor [Solirubrobacteraceae bacterium]